MRSPISLLVAALAIAGLLAGCAAPVAARAGQAPAAGAPVEKANITMWLDTTGSSTTAECIVKNVIESTTPRDNGSSQDHIPSQWLGRHPHGAGRRRGTRHRQHARAVVCI